MFSEGAPPSSLYGHPYDRPDRTDATMLLPLAARRLVASSRGAASAVKVSAVGRSLSTVAASTADPSDVPAYVLDAPGTTVTTLGNGVTVASSYGAG